MSFVRIKLGKFKSAGFGFKVQNKNGKLIVTQVFPNSVASEKDLRANDIIYSVNNEIINESPIEFSQRINQIKGNIQLLVHRSTGYSRSQHSFNNLSITGSDPINSISSEKLKKCRSSIDLINDDFKHRWTDDNFVPEDQIDCYMQSMSTGDTFDDSTNPIQITRKQAYRKPTNDAAGQDSPRISVKKATKSPSIYGKDPNITIKRRFTKGNDVVGGTGQRPRPAYRPLNNSKNTLQTHQGSTTLHSLANHEIISRSIILPDTAEYQSAPAASGAHVSESDILSLEQNKPVKPIKIEINVKILSFKDKIRKPFWRRFMVESDALGLLFHCLESDEVASGCNSTAIDPYISGLNFYMTTWASNNTISRFFLPIGQSPYDAHIDRTVEVDSIHVQYSRYDVDFLVDLARLSEEVCEQLLSVLGLEPVVELIKMAQTKTRKHHESAENLKVDRKSRPLRQSAELPRVSLISALPQTRLVENVPLVVVLCTNIIESLGIADEGIYRKSGNEALKKKLENVLTNESTEKWVNYDEWTNVHLVCSLFKTVLRGFGLIDRDTAIKLSMINVANVDRASQEQVYMDMVYHLRQHLCKHESRIDPGLKDRSANETMCRLDTFKYVIKHLYRVSRYQDQNKMTPDNLSTCTWPAIIEEIPCQENGDYQVSKKSDADRNLKQMVSFWIKNADLICELLEEDNEHQRYKRLAFFAQHNAAAPATIRFGSVSDNDKASLVKELIDYYVKEAFLPISLSISRGHLPTEEAPHLLRAKVGARSSQLPRRSSTSLSPKNIVRKVESPLKGFSPLSKKKIDNVPVKRSKSKKNDPTIPTTKEISLASLHLSGSVKNVPLIVEACITIVNQFGLNVDGIYRKSGRKQDLTALEDLVKKDMYRFWHQVPYISMWTDMYIVSGLLKSFLKRFPLIKKDIWGTLSSQFAEEMGREDVRKCLMSAALHFRIDSNSVKLYGRDSMTIERQEHMIRCATLRYVLRHLKTVSRHVNNNRMSSNSLAVCFMPVLMEEEDCADREMSFNVKGIQILEKLIDHCDWVFQWDDRPVEDLRGNAMADNLEEYLRGYSIKEIGSKAPKTDDLSSSQFVIECEDVRVVVEKLIKSSMVSDRLSRIRRYSDGTEGSTRQSEVLDSLDMIRNELPEKMLSATMVAVARHKESFL